MVSGTCKLQLPDIHAVTTSNATDLRRKCLTVSDICDLLQLAETEPPYTLQLTAMRPVATCMPGFTHDQRETYS